MFAKHSIYYDNLTTYLYGFHIWDNHKCLSWKETLEWFEEYLKSYKGTVLIISHDRYFLDRVVNKIILINNGK